MAFDAELDIRTAQRDRLLALADRIERVDPAEYNQERANSCAGARVPGLWANPVQNITQWFGPEAYRLNLFGGSEAVNAILGRVGIERVRPADWACAARFVAWSG